MKRKLLLILSIVLIGIPQICSAHKEWVHQYIVEQAYYLLEKMYQTHCGNINDINILKIHMFDESGNLYKGHIETRTNIP